MLLIRRRLQNNRFFETGHLPSHGAAPAIARYQYQFFQAKPSAAGAKGIADANIPK